ncbi:Protein CBG26459 [Caenorhabditis briggsae]|uniref:Protein CBG26459 n=1 Tax=Caenorhabditis briggsae TaxID=6238 RepID=B6IKP6_CAEBR|nr:Protein CBG26459 [Caenorhabditis briggsae]CAS00476.1 Protein CBG26459 [Caenorhabditis briggsae]
MAPYTSEEIWYYLNIIRNSKTNNKAEIHRKLLNMRKTKDERCPNRKTITRWVDRFLDGNRNFKRNTERSPSPTISVSRSKTPASRQGISDAENRVKLNEQLAALELIVRIAPNLSLKGLVKFNTTDTPLEQVMFNVMALNFAVKNGAPNGTD